MQQTLLDHSPWGQCFFLILFSSEPLIRIHRSTRSGDLQSWGNLLTDRQVLIWKYNRLDANQNKLLSSNEFLISNMKKILGKVKRGRKCGRKILNDCDYDKDKSLSQLEWNYCLRIGHRMSLQWYWSKKHRSKEQKLLYSGVIKKATQRALLPPAKTRTPCTRNVATELKENICKISP